MILLVVLSLLTQQPDDREWAWRVWQMQIEQARAEEVSEKVRERLRAEEHKMECWTRLKALEAAVGKLRAVGPDKVDYKAVKNVRKRYERWDKECNK
jgi:hypothetical protein